MHWKICLDLCLILVRVLEAIVVYKSSYDVCVHVLNCVIRFRILTANLKMILSSTCISMISTYSSIHIYRCAYSYLIIAFRFLFKFFFFLFNVFNYSVLDELQFIIHKQHNLYKYLTFLTLKRWCTCIYTRSKLITLLPTLTIIPRKTIIYT